MRMVNMIQVKDTKEIQSLALTAKDSCRILASRKKSLIQDESEYSFTDDYLGTIIRKYPDVEPELIQVFQLN